MNREGERLLAVAGFTAGVGLGLVWSILAPYLRLAGYSGTAYGLLGGSGVLAGAIAGIVAGGLSDKYGARRVMLLGIASEAFSLILLSFPVPGFLLAGYLLQGISMSFVYTGGQVLASRVGSDQRLRYTLSYLAGAQTIGGALGSYGGWLPPLLSKATGTPLLTSYSWTLRLGALIVLLAAPPISRVIEVIHASDTQGRISLGLRGLDKRLIVLLVVNILMGFGAAISVHNIDYYFAAKYGVTSAGLGTLFGTQQLIMGLLMFRLPQAAERAGGDIRLYIILSSLSIPLLVMITLVNQYYIAASLFLVRSILINVANPLFNAYAFSLIPRERRGMVGGLLGLTWTVPAGFGRAIGGHLLDMNLELPLRLTAALYSVAVIILASSTTIRKAGISDYRESTLAGPRHIADNT